MVCIVNLFDLYSIGLIVYIVNEERRMHEIREEAKAAKAAYEEAVARRSNSQRETNELLQRKSSWTDADVMRLTQLVRADLFPATLERIETAFTVEVLRAYHLLYDTSKVSAQDFMQWVARRTNNANMPRVKVRTF